MPALWTMSSTVRPARRAAAFLLLATLLAVPAIAGGDDAPRRDFTTAALTSPWRIEVGGALNAFETSAAWSPRGLSGAVIVLEDSLGLDEQTGSFYLKVAHRFNRRHSLELAATDLRRTATRQIDDDVEWGDYVFRAEGTVHSVLDTTILKLKYLYDFSDMDRLNAGFSAGLSTFELGLLLEGEARLESDEGEEWIEGVAEGAEVVAPVPVIGFFLDYALTPRWIVHFATEAIDLSVGDHRGHVVQTEASMDYAVSDLFGLGLVLGSDDLEYRGEEGGEKLGINYRITTIGLRASFSF